ncbi:hypothetical protein [Haloprofundus salilacus]|uniref:hypothetical protein n=1 Tax=Haloprofundus salilacus TaxID=2876190 RepID=UPI001CCC97D7|nr:hypothetical protein [Haloprofundus salilacus]
MSSIFVGNVAVGAVLVRYAYPPSRISEQLDAVGSETPPHAVEPADWKVNLTKVWGPGMVVLGAYFVVYGLFLQ